MDALHVHRARQNAERLAWGAAWADSGEVFTREDGSWLHPDTVSRTFRRISEAAGLPPISLRGLRHGAATLAHAGGGDLHTIKETLRHSTITLTVDTCLVIFEEATEELTERAAAVVPRARKTEIVDTAIHASLTQEAGEEAAAPPV